MLRLVVDAKTKAARRKRVVSSATILESLWVLAVGAVAIALAWGAGRVLVRLL